jgi:hypothetical protein
MQYIRHKICVCNPTVSNPLLPWMLSLFLTHNQILWHTSLKFTHNQILWHTSLKFHVQEVRSSNLSQEINEYEPLFS